jgi:signal transduction histidine kinase
MKLKLTYRQKIFFCFFVVFVLFIAGIIAFEQHRERYYKTETLSSDQNIYAAIVHQYIEREGLVPDSMRAVERLLPLFPDNIRITVIGNNGTVLYDNEVNDPETMENHKQRPEIMKAIVRGTGSNIRMSASTDHEFLYFARNYERYFVRIALPYNVEMKNFLKTDYVFLYFMIAVFFATLFVLIYLSNRFGNSISKMKDFVISAQAGDPLANRISFPDDELGVIGERIVDLYKQLTKSKKKLTLEREKLLQHFHYSEEGVCFFSRKKEKIYANSHFVQYLNLLTDTPTLNVNRVLADPLFEDLHAFWENRSESRARAFATNVAKNGKHFQIKSVCFDDGSFEITINDITDVEKNRFLKQEMTANIAHDLRTPVTSIRGYLETLKNLPELPDEKRRFFVERAFLQVVRLSDLIRDISLINRMEEASELFGKEQIRLLPLLEELQEDLSDKLQRQQINLLIKVSEQVLVEGNRILLYSIFRNLIDNTLAYAGEHISAGIDNYMEDADYYYFSYYDTGTGVGEEYLSRIFDRFYRIDEGRTSDTGGSGLGLSIVKNAVAFHKGEIVAKNRTGGGLEFLFMLKKRQESC